MMKNIDYKSIAQDERSYFLLYVIILSVYCVYNLFRWPITAGDTDLWYHLNGGRYFFDTLSIPKDSFFSFVVPSRKWLDYYWLFQILVYKIHEYSGYYGLICLRALLFMGLMFFVFRYLTQEIYKKRAYFAVALVSSLYLLFLLSRYGMIRPHMFSYFFIVLFLYVLDYRRKMAPVLPLVALAWVNIHGVVYPVMLLIALAYLAEFIIKRIRERKESRKEDLLVVIPLVLVLFMVYCTPHGVRLIGTPLTSTDFASYYINELHKFSFDNLTSLSFVKFVPNISTVFVVMLIMSCLAFIHVILSPQRKIGHLILFAGGLFLLTKGRRFGYEFLLLAMPVLKDAISSFVPVAGLERGRKLPVKIVFMCFLGLIPLLYIHNHFKNLPRFPVSNINLPHGIAAFLRTVDAGGSVLNHPNRGGYFQWMLYPKYRIYMDMEVPFLFTDEDMYVAIKVFTDRQVLDKVLGQYDPSFITVPVDKTPFRSLIKEYPRYKPVFFDDYEILYVNELHYPLIARTYLLEHIDPFTFPRVVASKFKNIENTDMIGAELEKMYRISPDNGIVNRGLSMLYLRKKDYVKAIVHADMIIRNYPESHVGYALKGDALKGSGQYEAALENYMTALKRKNAIFLLHRDIGLIYFEQKKFRKAYDTLIRAADIYTPGTSYRDLYYIIYSAVKVNLIKEAAVLYHYAAQVVPPEDKEWTGKYEELRVMITEGKEGTDRGDRTR